MPKKAVKLPNFLHNLRATQHLENRRTGQGGSLHLAGKCQLIAFENRTYLRVTLCLGCQTSPTLGKTTYDMIFCILLVRTFKNLPGMASPRSFTARTKAAPSLTAFQSDVVSAAAFLASY